MIISDEVKSFFEERCPSIGHATRDNTAMEFIMLYVEKIEAKNKQLEKEISDGRHEGDI